MRPANQTQPGKSTRLTAVVWMCSLLGLSGLLAAGQPAGAFASADNVTTTLSGLAPPATRGFPSVIILESKDGIQAAVASDPAVMNQVDKTFSPGVLVVRVGQVVEFRNSDELLHNVHLLDLETDATVFNVATPMKGFTYSHTFEKAGSYALLCDVHPEMEAYIVVTESPYATVTGEDGNFKLPEVPCGTYTLRVWNIRESRRHEQVVEVGPSPTEINVGRR